MNRSENIGELVAALAKAQMQFGSALKESVNPAFRSKYADLAANIGAVRPALNANGIALLQFNESDLERQTASVTTALHHGEQFISITAEAPATGRNGFDVQSIGAAWTYLRRYTLQAICGLASEDDDGEALAGADNKPIQRKTSTPVPPPPQHPQSGATSHNPKALVQFIPEGAWEVGPELITCVIKGVTEKTSKKGTQYLTVVHNGRFREMNYVYCYHASLFPTLKASIGKTVTFQFKESMGAGQHVDFVTLENLLVIDAAPYKPDTLLTDLSPFPAEEPHAR